MPQGVSAEAASGLLTLTIIAITVAFGAVVVAAVVSVRVHARTARAIERETLRLTALHDERVNDLLNRLAHAYDKPFETAPADEEPEQPKDDDDEVVTELSYFGSDVRDPVLT